jgi:hypothetical protein
MRLRTPDHREALALAGRLRDACPERAADDRRALLLYWYGFGASRLRAEDQTLLAAWDRHGGADHPLGAVVRADLARLAAEVAAIAGDPAPSAARLRRVGAALTAHLHLQDRGLCGAVGRALPAEERADVERALHAHG